MNKIDKDIMRIEIAEYLAKLCKMENNIRDEKRKFKAKMVKTFCDCLIEHPEQIDVFKFNDNEFNYGKPEFQIELKVKNSWFYEIIYEISKGLQND